MKAAVLQKLGTLLTIETVPDPVIGTGEVIVDVVAAPVLSYANEVFSGERNYLIELPMIPGCGAIGRVRATGPDATHLARGEGGARLQKHFHDGPFAEQLRVPTENAIRIGEIDRGDAASWCALNTMLVPYGGLLAAGLQACETLLVSGATGNFGSAGIAVALAMGAARVVAPGRNETVVADLVRRFGDRIRPVTLGGNEEDDRKRMQQAAGGAIDCVLDLLPPSAAATSARAAVMAVRPYGRVVLMGGVGMLGGDGLDLPYPWIMRNNITIRGQWMYSPDAAARLAAMIRSGLVRLDNVAITRFPLDDANEAVAHAAANGGPFNLTVIEP